MTPHLRTLAALAGTLSLSLLVNASSGIFDLTQVLFYAPAYMYEGQPQVPMTQAHLIYLGANTQDPNGPVVEYSFGMLDNGVLNQGAGFDWGIYIELERPSAGSAPPYHLIGLAVTGSNDGPGGLLIGGSRPSAWDGRDFNSLFPGVDQQDVVDQLRSGDLSGGAVEDLVTQMVLDNATLQSPDPMPVPVGSPLRGWVWGFSDSGSPEELGVLIDVDYQDDPVYVAPGFGMYDIENPIIPEAAATPGVFACLALAIGGWRWRTRRARLAPAN
jgi:hypothetical protein